MGPNSKTQQQHKERQGTALLKLQSCMGKVLVLLTTPVFLDSAWCQSLEGKLKNLSL